MHNVVTLALETSKVYNASMYYIGTANIYDLASSIIILSEFADSVRLVRYAH
jgi:hypothetical protein